MVVHCLVVISVKSWSVEKSLEISEGNLSHWLLDARHERRHRSGGEVDDFGERCSR